MVLTLNREIHVHKHCANQTKEKKVKHVETE